MPVAGAPSTRIVDVAVTRLDRGSQLVPYEQGVAYQRELHERVASGSAGPTVLLLEHEETFTAGSRTEPSDVQSSTITVVPTDRGGRITWHGPGQVVGYPIVAIPHPMDVVAYVRTLESIMIQTCDEFDVHAVRVPGRSGVWCEATEELPSRKIGAVGVRVSRGVTMHGFALNVNCDLSWTDLVVPCGIADAGVTSLAREGSSASLAEVFDVVARLTSASLGEYLAKGTDR